jgi:MFS transporter, putative metabolite transport protein
MSAHASIHQEPVMTTTSIEHSRPNRTHWMITMYAGGGEFCDGYILSIIGVALPLITAAFQLSTAAAGLIGSASLVGMFVGGLVFGHVTDRVGRQKVYLADIAAFIVLSVLQFFVNEPWQLVALRFGMGIAIGADFAIAGTIASEFAPQKARGPLLVVLVTMWSVGAASAYVVGWAMVSGGTDMWRWMLASSAIPAALILLLRIGTPESPRWLLSKGRVAEARAVVKQMLGPDADLTDMDTDSAARPPARTDTRTSSAAPTAPARCSSACSGPANCCPSTPSAPTSRPSCSPSGWPRATRPTWAPS